MNLLHVSHIRPRLETTRRRLISDNYVLSGSESSMKRRDVQGRPEIIGPRFGLGGG